MHPLRHPRNAALVGVVFVVIAIIFWAVPTFAGLTVPYNDVVAGATMLLFLGVAMAIMAYVLIAGSTDE
jgi:glycerol kinase